MPLLFLRYPKPVCFSLKAKQNLDMSPSRNICAVWGISQCRSVLVSTAGAARAQPAMLSMWWGIRPRASHVQDTCQHMSSHRALHWFLVDGLDCWVLRRKIRDSCPPTRIVHNTDSPCFVFSGIKVFKSYIYIYTHNHIYTHVYAYTYLCIYSSKLCKYSKALNPHGPTPPIFL